MGACRNSMRHALVVFNHRDKGTTTACSANENRLSGEKQPFVFLAHTFWGIFFVDSEKLYTFVAQIGK